jgi:excisionase family DNA binding protein
MEPNSDIVERKIEPLYVSVQAATQITGLSTVTIYRLIASERLSAVKAGAKTLVELASIKGYLASLPRFVGTTGQKAA